MGNARALRYAWTFPATLGLIGCAPDDSERQAAEIMTEARIGALEDRLIKTEKRVEALEGRPEPVALAAPKPTPSAPKSSAELLIGGADSGRRFGTLAACEVAREAILQQYKDQCAFTVCDSPRVLCVPSS